VRRVICPCFPPLLHVTIIPYRMKIKKLPNVLALHLKRFKYQEDLKKYIKLTYRVAFPFELRLFNTVDDVEDPDRLYELFGIVVHIGRYVFHVYVALSGGVSHGYWLPAAAGRIMGTMSRSSEDLNHGLYLTTTKSSLSRRAKYQGTLVTPPPEVHMCCTTRPSTWI
jgi:hypothetical protein